MFAGPLSMKDYIRSLMYCLNCGYEISPDAKFCPECGTQNGAKTGKDSSMEHDSSSMLDVKVTSVVAYMTWIGFIISICAGDKEGGKFYRNQALIFHIFSFGCFVPLLGWLWAIFMLVCFILGVIWAAEQTTNELPLIGRLRFFS